MKQREERTARNGVDLHRLVRLHNALVSVKMSMGHPRMDAASQWHECASMIYEIASDKETMRELREATKLYLSNNQRRQPAEG